MAEPAQKKAKLAEPVPAAEVITFKLLKHTPEGIAIEEDGVFPPEMTHQLFGEEESIRGYEGLDVEIFVTPRFQAWVNVKYEDKAPGATDLKTPFNEVFVAGFFECKEDFDAALKAEQPLALDTLGEQLLSEETEEGGRFIITHANLSQASPELKELHARAQAFLYFFVDAASAIDASDPQWEIFLALEQSRDGLELLGFATVYNFYAYPDRCRMRLSQVLVLPPHQGRGVGSLLLRALCQRAEAANAVDVAFEDASDALQRIRDRLDLQRMLRCPWLQEAAMHAVSTAAAALAPEGGEESDAAAELMLSPDDAARAQRELRITKLQVRRVWEALVLLLGSQVPQKEKVEAAVEAMLLKRLQNQVAAAKKDTTGKAVRDTETGFVMMRAPPPAAAANGAGPSTAAAGPSGPGLVRGGGMPVEGISAEKQEEAIEEAVEARMEELRQLLAGMAGGAK